MTNEIIKRRVTYTWKQDVNRRRIHMRPIDRKIDSHTTVMHADSIATYEGDFDVEINIEELLRPMLRRASKSPTGKTTAIGGAIKVKRVNGKTRVLLDEPQTLRIPKGWEVCAPLTTEQAIARMAQPQREPGHEDCSICDISVASRLHVQHDPSPRNTPSKWFAVLVTRPDAGGELYAPVRYINNEPHESGDTPSYDREAVQRRCDELNDAARS